MTLILLTQCLGQQKQPALKRSSLVLCSCIAVEFNYLAAPAAEFAKPALHGSACRAQAAILSTSTAGSAQQPWQLAAMQTAADFDNDTAAAAERSQQVATLLSGMLHPKVTGRLSANQLVQLQCLKQRDSTGLQQCPDLIQSLL